MESSKKLIKNSWIFTVGNLSSKILLIIMVPVYTYYLSKEDYGTADMILTTVSLILPIVTLSIFDATFRFSMDNKYNKKSIFTNSIVIFIIGILIISLIGIITYFFNFTISIFFYIIVIIQSFYAIISQFVKSLDKTKEFVIGGILITINTVCFNIILIMILRMGLEGYLLSIIFSNIISTIYLIFKININKYFDIKYFEFKLLKKMVKYSIPLIPNSIMWWIMNALDRYIIIFILGVEFNGLYAIAHKIPSIISLFSNAFFQAWQISAIQEKENKKEEFYNRIFSYYSVAMIIVASMIFVINKQFIQFILAEEYKSVWKYTPFLIMAVIFMGFSSFIGTNYIVIKKTKGILKTTILGAIINLFLNLLFIPIIGLNGAAISTMISFLIVFIIRLKDTKKFIYLDINKKTALQSLLVLLIQICIMYSNLNYQILIQVILFVVILNINRSIIKNIINKNLFIKFKKKYI